MKVLFVSNLFPDAAEPNRGIYNARLVHHLGMLCEVRVVSPRPTRGFPPFWSPKPRSPRAEDLRFGPVFPPAAYIPKVGSRWNHKLMARSVRETLTAVRAEFPFETVLSSWVYPDACAVAELARQMNFPFAAIAQGSDVHQYLQIPARRRIMVAALNEAMAVITRSQALEKQLREAGVAGGKLHTVYNGVETGVFKPGDRTAARSALGLAKEGTLLLFVGNFLPIKNPLLLLDALGRWQQQGGEKKMRLVMLGDGPLRGALERRIRELGLSGQISLPGRKNPAEVARHMQAADLLCVSSDNEGVPNVVLEAFACGLKVLATNVGGLAEVVTAPHLGILVPPGDPTRFASGIGEALARPTEPGEIARHAENFSWPHAAAACLKLLNRRGNGGIA